MLTGRPRGGPLDLGQVRPVGGLAAADQVQLPAVEPAAADHLAERLDLLELLLGVAEPGGDEPADGQDAPGLGAGVQVPGPDRREQHVRVDPPEPPDPVPGVLGVGQHPLVGAEELQVGGVAQQPGEALAGPAPRLPGGVGHVQPAHRHPQGALVAGPGHEGGAVEDDLPVVRAGRQLQLVAAEGGRGGLQAGQLGPALVADDHLGRAGAAGAAQVEHHPLGRPAGELERGPAAGPDPGPAPASLGREPAEPPLDHPGPGLADLAAEEADQAPLPAGQVVVEGGREVAEVQVAGGLGLDPAHVGGVDEQLVLGGQAGDLRLAPLGDDAEVHLAQVEAEVVGQDLLADVPVADQVDLVAVVGQDLGEHAGVALSSTHRLQEPVVDRHLQNALAPWISGPGLSPGRRRRSRCSGTAPIPACRGPCGPPAGPRWSPGAGRPAP